jgi:hypothetical protein
MTNTPVAPFAAVAIGTIAGFAMLVPFGGLRLGQPSGPVVRCSVMRCETVKIKMEPANGPSVGSHVPSQGS